MLFYPFFCKLKSNEKRKQLFTEVCQPFRYLSSVKSDVFSQLVSVLKLISKNIFLSLTTEIAILSLAMKTSKLITFGKACEVFKVWRSSWHLVASRKLVIPHHAQSCLREAKCDPVTFTTGKNVIPTKEIQLKSYLFHFRPSGKALVFIYC